MAGFFEEVGNLAPAAEQGEEADGSEERGGRLGDDGVTEICIGDSSPVGSRSECEGVKAKAPFAGSEVHCRRARSGCES